MRTKRLFATATAAALLMSGPISATAMAQAGDPPPARNGVGTGLVESTLLAVDIGTLLNLDLLDDLGSSTIDPVNGVPLADGTFNPLKLTSSVLGEKSVGSITTSSTGGEDGKSLRRAPSGELLPIVSGVLDGSLTSVVDGDGARSDLLAGIGNLDLVGGLLGMAASPQAVSFTTNAAPANAGGVRGLDVGSIDLLNLGNLLAGIGLPLEGLPLVGDAGTTITGLLDGLGIDAIPVGGDSMSTDEVVSTVTDLVGALDVLTGFEADDTLAALDEEECGDLPPLPILGDLVCTALPTEGLPLVGDLATAVSDTLIGDVVDMLSPILGGALPVLDGLNLVSVGGITAQMQSSATDSLDTSNADVVAQITSLEVAGLDAGALPLVGGVLDLTQGANVLSGVGTTISNSLNGALGLDNLLDIDVLDITEIVEPDGDYTKALSTLTAMAVKVNPLGGTVNAMQVGGLPINAGDILGDGLPLGGDMLALAGLLDPGGIVGGVTSILTQGLGIEVGRMSAAGSFTAAAALPPGIVPPAAQPVTPPADGVLPRTGADTALPAVLAAIMAATAIGVRRLVRTEKVEI